MMQQLEGKDKNIDIKGFFFQKGRIIVLTKGIQSVFSSSR